MNASLITRDGLDDAEAVRRLRVAVIASNSFQQQALVALFQRSHSLRVVAVGARPAELNPQVAIDALLVDPGEPADESLIDAALATEQPLVVLLRHPALRVVEALNRSGASVLPLDTEPTALSAALHCAAAGLVALAPEQIRSWSSGQSIALPEPLTARECEVLALLADGLPNRGIANALAISAHTAKFHVAQILAKLQATSRAQAVAIALREGLVGSPAEKCEDA